MKKIYLMILLIIHVIFNNERTDAEVRSGECFNWNITLSLGIEDIEHRNYIILKQNYLICIKNIK